MTCSILDPASAKFRTSTAWPEPSTAAAKYDTHPSSCPENPARPGRGSPTPCVRLSPSPTKRSAQPASVGIDRPRPGDVGVGSTRQAYPRLGFGEVGAARLRRATKRTTIHQTPWRGCRKEQQIGNKPRHALIVSHETRAISGKTVDCGCASASSKSASVEASGLRQLRRTSTLRNGPERNGSCEFAGTIIVTEGTHRRQVPATIPAEESTTDVVPMMLSAAATFGDFRK